MRTSPGPLRADLVSLLDSTIAQILEPLVPTNSPCALIDFPDHANAGDSAIWVGEKAALKRAGALVAYTCDTSTYDPDHLARRVGRGTIFLHGGGNLGDIWPKHQTLREAVIQGFPNNKIVQLAQSVHFGDRSSLDRARVVMQSHPDLTLLVRDGRSYEFALSELRVPTILCPDMAYAIGPLARVDGPCYPILWMARADRESSGETVPVADDVVVSDWVPEFRDLSRWRRTAYRKLNRRRQMMARRIRRSAGERAFIARASEHWYDNHASRHLRRGRRFLSQGSVVVTDRLHGHILCQLMGIRHVLCDNNYGKVSSFHEAWTKTCELTVWADNPSNALATARSILKEQG